jgi:ubiquinone/menaquinone biosynthesis C-methylase UbiE
MRIGFKGENLGEKLFLASGMLPEMAIIPFFSTVVGNAVMTAQRLCLFEILRNPATVEKVVAETGTDFHATQVLLESLTSFGYLKRNGGQFKVSRAFEKSLNGKFAEMANAMLGFAPDVAKKFENLDDAVKTGKVDNFHFVPITPAMWSNYLTFLKGVSGDTTKQIVKKVKFAEPPKKMLDIAGGPAQYSIAFCRKYPTLEAVILDLPESAEEGVNEIEKANLEKRITYKIGNFFETEWGNDYDFALLSHILHCLSAEQCQTVIKKAFAALKSGGILTVNDVEFPGEDESKIEMSAGWSSLLYFTMMGTRTHPTPTIAKWMREAGFSDIKKTTIQNAAQLTGQK